MGQSDIVCLFVDYGQPYATQESEAAHAIAWEVELPLVVVKREPLPMLANGVFPGRNEMLFAEAVKQGATTVVFGTRNPFAIWDRKYRDSNAQWARKVARKLGVKVKLPCLCLPKRILEYWLHWHGLFLMCFSTEGWLPPKK